VPHRILIIEDDPRLAGMVSEYLGNAGYRMTVAPSGEEGLVALARDPFDALVLDLMLPDIDGLEVCRRVRAGADALHGGASQAGIPILMLTARGDATDRVVGLELGADDYLPKPFEPRELLARLRALLRRTAAGANGGAAAKGTARRDVLRFGRMEIDRGAREVRIDGEARALTAYQFALLAALATHAGRVLSREAIMDLVKGEALEAFDRSIDVHISRIRQAIEADPKKPRRIVTVRGAGYVFAKSQD
jgi:two-component system, OmpR family, phosphate regulon response regulator OmpR